MEEVTQRQKKIGGILQQDLAQTYCNSAASDGGLTRRHYLGKLKLVLQRRFVCCQSVPQYFPE